MMTAREWFQDGNRILFDRSAKAIVDTKNNDRTFSVFERVVVSSNASLDGSRWLTMLPGFPDGSYGWSKVDSFIKDETRPRLYVEYVGQGDSEKPNRNDYQYGTMERADLVEAQWEHHGVKKTVIATFDYSSLVLMELLQRQRDRMNQRKPVTTKIEHLLLINGGYFADGHSHPIMTTPLLQTWMGRMGCWMAQRSHIAFNMMIKPLFSTEYNVSAKELNEIFEAITRHNGAIFMSNAAGFVREHKQLYASRWDLKNALDSLDVSVKLVGSEKDEFEPKQLVLAKERLDQKSVDTVLIPGGHMATSEQAETLAEFVDEMIAKK